MLLAESKDRTIGQAPNGVSASDSGQSPSMRQGGVITVITTQLSPSPREDDSAASQLARWSRVMLAGGKDDAQVVLSVSDTERGMDSGTRARIFEHSFSSKGNGGTGLGLATGFALVSQYQGAVTIDESPGEGATFTIAFPRAMSSPQGKTRTSRLAGT